MREIARGLMLAVLIIAGLTPQLLAEEALPADLVSAIDKNVTEAIGDSGTPSASIVIIRDGKIAYTHAYGLARVNPSIPALSPMRYRIGSVSKQFVAAAVMLLVEDQKLSLDDKLDHWFPDLTRAGDVTIRQLLSMTAGYTDYWPQDYVMPSMLQPTTPKDILKKWGRKPLDFEPGSKWQYSNTNYVIAGQIVEKVAEMPLFEFLQKRIFKPLEMASVMDCSNGTLGTQDSTGYVRYALGPVRPAGIEGTGWLYASADLAMTAGDLAKWNLAMINQQLLKPESYHAMQSEVQTSAGAGTAYGLGVGVRVVDEHRMIWHDGLVSGYSANNYVFPDDRSGVVVLTNLESGSAGERIAMRLAGLILPNSDPGGEAAAETARKMFEGLQHAKIDRKLLTENASAYFSQAVLTDFATSLGHLGKILDFAAGPHTQRGGMILRRYRVRMEEKSVEISTLTTAEGKVEQFLVTPGE